MPKGLKNCSSCGKQCGCRSKKCPHCNSSFTIKSTTTHVTSDFDWKTLCPKDKIESIYGRHIGIFTVRGLDTYGIKCIQGISNYYLNMVERAGPAGPIKIHVVRKI